MRSSLGAVNFRADVRSAEPGAIKNAEFPREPAAESNIDDGPVFPTEILAGLLVQIVDRCGPALQGHPLRNGNLVTLVLG